jgi:predicted metal-binding membrane protein
MMLPSLTPMLWRYKSRFGLLTPLVVLGYFFVWTLVGCAVYPLGVALAAVEMEQPALARAVPLAVAVVIFIAGAVQFTSWKAHHLARCRETKADADTAWRQGLRLGFHCMLSCANLTAILLVIGVMDLRAMTLVTAVITAERLAPAPGRIAQVIGAIVAGAGLLLIARATGLA